MGQKRTREESETDEYSQGYGYGYGQSVLTNCENAQNGDDSILFLSQNSTNTANSSFNGNEDWTYYETQKRVQLQKITTEAHQRTVAMMMEASKELSRREKAGLYQGNSDHQEVSVDEEMCGEMETKHYQRPFW